MSHRDQASWQIEYPQARLVSLCGSLSATLDVTAPSKGLQALRIGDEQLLGHVLGAGLPQTSPLNSSDVADTYVRGTDVIVTYAEHPRRPFSCQFYWQSSQSPFDVSTQTMLSLLTSIQTSRLQSEPIVAVTTTLRAESIVVERADGPPVELTSAEDAHQMFATPQLARAVSYRLAGTDWRYVEMIDGSAPRSLSMLCDGDQRWTSQWTLFGEFLEKGVIRRTRTHGLFVREADLAARPAAAQDYVRGLSLPLTT